MMLPCSIYASQQSCRRLPQFRIFIRGKKSKTKLSYGKSKNDPTELALKHFDQNYRPLFGEEWPSIRLSLLSMQGYGALLNNYSDVQPTVERLHSLGIEDIIQSRAEKVSRSCRERRTEAKRDPGASYADERRTSQNGNTNDDSGTTSRSDDVARAEELQKREIIKLAREEEENWDNVDGYAEEGVRSARSEGTNAPDKAWWEGKYIVAPGYEHRMDLIQRIEMEEESQEATAGYADIDFIDGDIQISPNLRCFVHRDGPKRLPPAKKGTEFPYLQYYLMDAASILPVLALDVRPDDVVLDLCAGPGGKSLAVLQTLLVGSLTANEKVSSRKKRLQDVFGLFLPRVMRVGGAVRVSGLDGSEWGKIEPQSYDKVLVDVPCSTDRVSATEADNNLFKVSRSRERWNLPQLQADLLSAGIQAAKPGGTIVYSTCTMSPLQNDGVVQSAITRCQEDFGINANVVDLSPLAEGFGDVFSFFSSCRYGQLVVPRISANYGPMYFARLQRTL